ncbi:TonB-dependent receptor [Moheibacter lacus]|uniref:TonB-dependent receptor n=1 Tax=Moheibacter lacus TaxID=2745851 RepID=A0A838ZS18_9FLAO|nr:TonB-dependent receptor [Moheibacter lacus]MBA5629822.1 TonB-dependent receptor [Moheibacter lacus]
MRGSILLTLILFNLSIGYSQNSISGKIIDEFGEAVSEAKVTVGNQTSFSDENGAFIIPSLKNGQFRILVSHDEFEDYSENISIVNGSFQKTIILTQKFMLLEESVVVGNLDDLEKKSTSQSLEIVNQEFIQRNLSGSLMQSLEKISGVNAMSIGSGQSKPQIRGLGFNRVIVTEEGVKHEGQQWGADHGLEIDQFSIGKVKVLKGPASLLYGSDAIGGIIQIERNHPPEKYSSGGEINLIAKSNNNLLGTSAQFYNRIDHFFYDFRTTYLDYADYKVPVDQIQIYSYNAELHENKLRNTAGRELNFHLSTGYLSKDFISIFHFSNLYSKNGLFANAHGLEPRNVNSDLYDESDRDIDFPYQNVNHFKLINQTKWKINSSNQLELNIGFQNNYRNEYGFYISHGYMPSVYPSDLNIDQNLERQFNKSTYSFNVKDELKFSNHELTIGINSEFQQNQIGGWGFLIPDFEQYNLGLFAFDQIKFGKKFLVHLGLRYDYGKIKTEEYFDWFTTPVNGNPEYLQRSTDLDRSFENLTWAIGANYNLKNWNFRLNAGKSFRMPLAKELASNGVNYHYFSYELGNPDLSPEQAYQLDLGLTFSRPKISVDINPFFNYFTNYIYLNPTPNYDYDYGAGNQIYEYAEAEVLRYGGEININYQIFKNLNGEILGEYVYSEQQSSAKKGFTLPFSPPASVLFSLKYEKDFNDFFKKSFAMIDYKIVADQNEIVPPEVKTSGYQLINLSFGTELNWGKTLLQLNFQIQNLLDSENYNHTNFYRLIGVPEPGRNFVLSLKIPFEIK